MRSLLLSSLLACLIAPLPVLAQPTDFGQGTQVGRVEGIGPLTPEMARVYRSFRREARYFAAMAVNMDSGVAFWIQNFHDAGRARAGALEGCDVISLRKPGCAIYAVAMPESLPIAQSRATGLSEEAADALATVYTERRIPGTYAAFAISGISHFGYADAELTEADARDTAIAYCNRGLAADMAELGPDGRRFARARGWDKCRVIDVQFTPPAN
ncbi:hypothetical protein KDD17_08800 [Sulfitobacter albidus]|uniref:DUF4189 domain-containing protein n=1 Tax=Sulfitobacter albidus TaxID=2829501 RepID=A0A975JAY2_9RHOB|nr:hypothetical protein [Sulfitobacter albidus]QUJ75129.1 hypothetical protein KDD17_08800 [Sulfitobacter albidus]